MNGVCKVGKSGVEEEEVFSEDIIIEILHRLPSKSLARFKCVSKCWQNYIADCRCRRWKQKPCLVGFFFQPPELPHISSQIYFFLSSSKQQVIDFDLSLDKTLEKFRGQRIRVVASSNGFLLCSMKGVHYYVYNPSTRQQLALPKTQICMEDNPAVGFICKVDNPDEDIVSFSIVRYAIPPCWDTQFSVTIESFSSETNSWTANNIILDVPLKLLHFSNMKSPSASVVDGVFCWLDDRLQITVYDSIYKRFWALKLPQGIETGVGGGCYLGLSGGGLYFALKLKFEGTIIVWYLASNIRSRDAIWVKKYVGNVGRTILQQGLEAFGFESYVGYESCIRKGVENMTIHPAVPHIFYLDVLGTVISYDFETDVAEFVYEFGGGGETRRYKLIAYEWHQWPRLL